MANLSDYSDSEDVLQEYEKEIKNENDSPNVVEFHDDTDKRIDNNDANKNVNVHQKSCSRAPMPVLNTERLKGSKGIHTIEKHFEGFKFYGKGHEKTDLARVMKRLEHWAHRLFPKLDFDDFLEKLEKLGCKRDLSVFISKYRRDIITANDEVIQQTHDNSDEDSKDVPIDEFDLLISEQIIKQKEVNKQQNDENDIFMPSGTCNSVQTSQNLSEIRKYVSLDEETRQKIERNRQQAIQRRLLKLKAVQNAERKIMEETKEVNIASTEEQKLSTDDYDINSQTC